MIHKIDVVSHAVDHIDLRMSFEIGNDACNSIWIIDVVGIEPADDFTIRGADALVDGIGLALVLLRCPFDAVAETLEYLDGVVGTTAVENHVVDVDATLRGNAFQSPLNELSLIVRRRNNANSHVETLSGNSEIDEPSLQTISHFFRMTDSSRRSSPTPVSAGMNEGVSSISKKPPAGGNGTDSFPSLPRGTLISALALSFCRTCIVTLDTGAQLGTAISRSSVLATVEEDTCIIGFGPAHPSG